MALPGVTNGGLWRLGGENKLPGMRFGSVIGAGLMAAAGCVGAAGQQMTVAHVAFRSAGDLPQAALEAAAGMHAGDKVTVAGIRAAAGRLVATGYFADVHVDSSGAPGALTVIYLLKPLPAEERLPLGFENFVWLTDAESLAAVRQVDPLYDGSLPPGAPLDAIAESLKAALAAKGVGAAGVAHEEILPTTAQPVHALQFRVSRPEVVINQVTLDAQGPMAAAVVSLAAKMHGSPYVAGYAPATTADLLLRPYLDAGYAEARLVDLKLAAGPGTPNRVALDLAARVDPGQVFQVGAITFADSPLMPGAAFAAVNKLHTGDPASRKQLLATLGAVDEVYKKQGYLDEYVDTVAKRDEANHTVQYAFKVVPGEPYRMHTLTVRNLSPEARAQFDLAWTMKAGEPYNADYVARFLNNNTAMKRLSEYTGSFQAAADPETHQVDLTVTFVPTGGRR